MDTPNAQRLRRSLLFVPGAEPRKLEKAREAGADTLLLDLEDAVAPERKAEARANVAAAIRAGVFGNAEVAVRVNAPDTPYFEADIAAVIGSGGSAILLPKSEAVDQIVAVADTIDRLERETSRMHGLKLLLLVESSAGITQAAALGRATPRVAALCFGHADFSLSMGLTDADAARGIVYHARCTLVIAAKACGVAPIDTVYLAVKDDAAFRDDAALGLQLGFEGKLCIHPRQVEIANQVYTPRPEQIEYAQRVIEASARAQSEGRGVFALDGKMIDAPLVAVQERILERARRAGVLSA
jgi:citrate lyase subunit beta / citryl-CoA lyase